MESYALVRKGLLRHIAKYSSVNYKSTCAQLDSFGLQIGKYFILEKRVRTKNV